MTLSINTYYLWKWADNDLSGKPSEVFSRLLHGQMHPAIQSFDARPILRGLNGIAAKRRALGEEWDWQIQPDAAPNRAHFLFLRCPAIACCGGFGEYFIDLVEHQWGLSGYAEQKGSLIQGLPPKLNSFSLGDFFEEPQFDISESDLPALLGQIHPEARCPFAILSNRANHYVQCYVRRNGIQVEWHKCRHIDGAKDCLQWRAGYRNQRHDKCKPKFISEQRTVDGESRIIKFQQFPQEQLRFGDVLHIFQTFFCGAPRPAQPKADQVYLYPGGSRWQGLAPLTNAPIYCVQPEVRLPMTELPGEAVLSRLVETNSDPESAGVRQIRVAGGYQNIALLRFVVADNSSQ